MVNSHTDRLRNVGGGYGIVSKRAAEVSELKEGRNSRNGERLQCQLVNREIKGIQSDAVYLIACWHHSGMNRSPNDVTNAGCSGAIRPALGGSGS